MRIDSMRVLAVLTVGSLVLVNLTGCRPDDSGTPSSNPATSAAAQAPQESTVTIEGEKYTCEKLLYTTACSVDLQKMFDTYGQNIHAFVTSKQLGPLDQLEYYDIAFAGLVACWFNTLDGYIDFMQNDEAFAGWPRADFVSPWFRAKQLVCPTGNGHGSFIVP